MKIIFFLALTLPVFNADLSCAGDEYCAQCTDSTSTTATAPLNCELCYGSIATTNATTNLTTCVAPTTKIDDCISYSAATTCSGCDKGYYLSGNACVEIPLDDCLSYNATTKLCLACDEKVLGADGLCTDTDCTDDNCEACTATSCALCKDGYSFSSANANLTCYKSAEDHCAVQTTSSDSTAECTQCRVGYLLTIDGECKPGNAMVMFVAIGALIATLF